MDSLTQAVVGAVVGEVVLGRKLGWRGAAWGAALGTLPDLDILAYPFLSEAEGIRWHRGISHSLLLIVLAPFLLARPLAWLHRRREVGARTMGWMVFWVWGTHVLIDCFNAYGTQIFEPFSDQRVGLGNFFIIDPLFTVPLVLGLVWALWSRGAVVRRRRVMWGAIGVSWLYVVFSVGMKLWAMKAMEDRIAREMPGADLVSVSPTTFNTILWRGLAETPDGYHVLYWSPFDEEEGAATFVEKRRELVEPFEGDEVLEALQWFSCGHWVARRGGEGTVVVIDMRFGEVRDGEGGPGLPIFQWHLREVEPGRVTAPMKRPQVDFRSATALVWQRMWGDQSRWNRVAPF